MDVRLQKAAANRRTRRAPVRISWERIQTAVASTKIRGTLRWWPVILLALIVGTLSSIYFASHRAAYQAETTLVLGPNELLEEPREIIDSLDTLDRRSVVATFAALPPSRTVRERAQQQLRLSGEDAARYQVQTVVLPDTNVLAVKVEGPDRRTVAAFANAIAHHAAANAAQIYSIYGLKVLDPAGEPTATGGAGKLRMMIMGALLGLLIGFAAAFILEVLRKLSAPDPRPAS